MAFNLVLGLSLGLGIGVCPRLFQCRVFPLYKFVQFCERVCGGKTFLETQYSPTQLKDDLQITADKLSDQQ